MKTVQFELTSLRYKQQLLAILMFGLVTVVIWITVSLASSQTTTKITPAQQQAAKSLNPNINQELLTTVEQKRRYTAEELQRFTIYRVVSDQEVRERQRTPSAVIGPSLSSELGLASESQSDVIATESAVTSSPTPSPTTLPPTANENVVDQEIPDTQ